MGGILRIFYWTLVFCTGLAVAAVPPNYILHVDHRCGINGVDDAEITVITDVDATAVAKCVGGDVALTRVNMANFRLPVSYPGQGSSDCVFYHQPGSRVFVVTVLISYGELANPVHQLTEEYSLTCTFDPKSTSNSTGHGAPEQRLIAPVEIQGHAGAEANDSYLSLTLTDILGKDFVDPVPTGRAVQLKATASGGTSAVGVQPTACDAVGTGGSSTKRYAILRGGCGDGLVFRQDEGFSVDGLTATSPFFRAMTLAGATTLRFECNFTLCMTDCDGSTCAKNARRRRDTTGYGNDVIQETASVVVSVYRSRKRIPSSQKKLEKIVGGNKLVETPLAKSFQLLKSGV